jgi:hypothetical protein
MTRKYALKYNNRNFTLKNLFILSFTICTTASFVGPFRYTIYNMNYFILFFLFDLLFFLGLSSGNVTIKVNRKASIDKNFYITSAGRLVLFILNILSACCFIYFVWLFLRSVGFYLFGEALLRTFDENGRTNLEKITLALMHLGAETVYLIINSEQSRNTNKAQYVLSSVCLFLPGIRSVILGKRFVIVVELIIFIYVNRSFFLKPAKDAFIRRNHNSILARMLIFLIIIVVIWTCMWLFTSRTNLAKLLPYMFYPGDTQLNPFWEWLRQKTEGVLDPFYTFSDYLAQMPFVFSYYLSNYKPERILMGAYLLTPFVQLGASIFPGLNSAQENMLYIASGKYSGIGYMLIADFGMFFGLLMAYFAGMLFSKIEKSKCYNRVSYAVYPCIVAICIFAPVYYFNVGRSDYTLLFTCILAPLFLGVCAPRSGIYPPSSARAKIGSVQSGGEPNGRTNFGRGADYS